MYDGRQSAQQYRSQLNDSTEADTETTEPSDRSPISQAWNRNRSSQHAYSSSVSSTLSGALDMRPTRHDGSEPRPHQTIGSGSPAGSSRNTEVFVPTQGAWDVAGATHAEAEWNVDSSSVMQDDSGWFMPSKTGVGNLLGQHDVAPSSAAASSSKSVTSFATPSSTTSYHSSTSGITLPSHTQSSASAWNADAFAAPMMSPGSDANSSTITPTSSAHTLTSHSQYTTPYQHREDHNDNSMAASTSALTAESQFQDMDWETFLREFPTTQAGILSSQIGRSAQDYDATSSRQSDPSAAALRSSSSSFSMYDQVLAANRLERLTEEETAEADSVFDRQHPSSAANIHSQQSSNVQSSSASSSSQKQPTRSAHGHHASIGASLFQPQRSSRPPSADLSAVRQMYSSSHGRIHLEGRNQQSGGSNETSSSQGKHRRRAGTVDSSQSSRFPWSHSPRLASSMTDPEEASLDSLSSSSLGGHVQHVSPYISPFPGRQSHGDLQASITAEFESLGLDFGQYGGGVQDVTMGDMYEDGMEILRPAGQSSFRGSSHGTGDASFASTSSTTLESSGLDDSLLASTNSAQHSSFRTQGETPLSSPAFSANLQLYPSPGPSRYSSFSSSQHNHTGSSQKGKGKASEFGVIAHNASSETTWPQVHSFAAFVQPARHASGVDSTSKGGVVSRKPKHPRASTHEALQPRPGQWSQVHPSRSADALSDQSSGLSQHLSERGARPISLDYPGASKSLPSQDSALRQAMGNSSTNTSSTLDSVINSTRSGSRRVDYDEVSEALETLRTFLQQRESARAAERDAGIGFPDELPGERKAGRLRTLRHTSGKLPPRGSVRLDGAHQGSSAMPSRGSASHHQPRRQYSSFLSTMDSHSRGQDRLDVVQHLSEKVKALRQRSQRFQHEGTEEGTEWRAPKTDRSERDDAP
ncbi:unnamed protein product [Sympodiomycopsis kandeliae]